MTSAIKSFLILLVALPLLIYIGSEIGSDEYFVPFAVGVAIAVGMLIALFFRSQRLECLVLTFLIGGYLVGNRGFAQLAIVQPLFVGELGLAVTLVIMLIRFAATRELVMPKSWLGVLVGVYLGLAFLRLCFDYSLYGIDAVRDSAIVYYAVFFFVAYQLGRRSEVPPFIQRALVAIIVLQATVATVFILKPEWFDLIEVHGISPLLQKTDLTGTFSAMGVIFLALHPELISIKWLRKALVLLLIACVILLGSRAATVGMLATLPLIWISKRRGFIAIPSLLMVSGLLFVLTIGPLVSERFSSVHEEFASIFDPTGTQHFGTAFGEEKQADNRFRLALWQSIYDQTVHENWLVGRGFGYDFVTTFEREFGGGHWEGLRSAHNYFVTTFGRLGVVGCLIVLGIVFCTVKHAVQAALTLRRGETNDTGALSFWCLGIIIMVSGTFGVVMEGPMGAIPLWSILGLALASNDQFALEQKTVAAESAHEVPVPHLMPSPLPRPVRAG